MRWVKPLCGAVTEIQSLNILRIQPRKDMVAWRFVQYTPPGFKQKDWFGGFNLFETYWSKWESSANI